MEVQILELIEGARRAEGLTVIIDVFRAFTLECYAFAQGAVCCYPTASLEDAYALKREDPERILIGERGGAKVEGCDLGNSPLGVTLTDFQGKEFVHSTSAGTQGIINAAGAGAQEIITGALVNARAVTEYIRAAGPEKVSIVAMGLAGRESTPEDLIAAGYMKSLLTGEEYDLSGALKKLRYHGGEKFFDPSQPDFPEGDYPLCVDADRFPFVLRAGEEGGRLVIRRVDPPFCA